LSELVATFEAYEKALVTNDIETLNKLFWDSPATVRFGTRESERQYGHVEIAEFRIRRGPVNQPRILRNQRITTFGREFGIARTSRGEAADILRSLIDRIELRPNQQ
jgi:AtzH-like